MKYECNNVKYFSSETGAVGSEIDKLFIFMKIDAHLGLSTLFS
jgi:hypothetical protein